MSKVYAIAHRGFSAAAPENTLSAFEKALEYNPDMIECDVRRTKDGHLIVIHDATVDRTTNGKGAVAGMTLAELQKLDAGSWFSLDFAGERIPTLNEVLDLIKDSSTNLIIEVKEEHTEGQVASAVREKQMSDQVMIASFHYSVGVHLRELAPNIAFIPLKWLAEKADHCEAVRVADEAAAINGSLLGINYTAISPAMVKATHAANLQLMAWTVDDETDMRNLVEMGVDAIASNRIDVLSSVLREMNVRI
jgi:glycerophosphoryl diester phosphodiesterase